MVEVHCPVLDGRFLNKYLELFAEELRERRRHYALFKVLKLFVEFSGCENLDQAITKFRENNGENLHFVVQKVINYLKERGKDGKPLAPKTVRQYISLLKNFLEFYDIDTERAWKKIKLPRKVNQRVERIPKLYELQKLILAFRSPRMRLLVQLLAQTGLRINEALNLKVADIDLEEGWIRVRPKNDKMGRGRLVPIINELKNALKEYLEKRTVDSPYLFPNEKDPSKPAKREHVYEAWYNALEKLGLARRDPSGTGYELHFHSLRKWFKTRLEMGGINPRLIDKWMGHKNDVQDAYFLPTEEMMKKELEKAEGALTIFGKTEYIPASIEEAIEEVKERIEALEKREKMEAFIDGRVNPPISFEEGKKYLRSYDLHERVALALMATASLTKVFKKINMLSDKDSIILKLDKMPFKPKTIKEIIPWLPLLEATLPEKDWKMLLEEIKQVASKKEWNKIQKILTETQKEEGRV